MRISTAQIFSLSLNQINSSLNDVTELTIMNSSQKKVNSPSDDPAGMGRMVELSGFQQSLTGYLDNCGVALDYLDTADQVLSTASETITAALELAEQASTETYTDEEMRMMALEMRGYLDALYAIANTQMGSDSIFAGDDTEDNAYEMGLGVTLQGDSPSRTDFVNLTGEVDGTVAVRFTSDGAVGTDALDYEYSTDGGETWTSAVLASGDTVLDLADAQVELASGTAVTAADDDGGGSRFSLRQACVYTGSDKAMSVAVSESTSEDMTTVGSDIFGGVDQATGQPYGSPNLFETLSDCIVHMESGDSGAVAQCLEDLGDCHETVEAGAAGVGARENKITYTQTSQSLVKSLAANAASSIEDADAAQLVVELEQANYVYQAVLSTASSVMSMSLLDYI
ncbi:Flagellar hook-associated protein 3 [Pseudodesulfovibrio hydrargyri]|uniref:Flagellin n=1 Tax=Pseudodesulfovibrio hydrargyri TaxID=2125990 RepID=A0A1J5MXU9_9BACT|nr:flagellin [Pseudodesulfovibrio hydrargyri]OIQ50802.1 Flagellar hook-associated protein 3 [Pseudodesulfovibrio hydrargyri]